MKQDDRPNSPRTLADLERAAWFARLALGTPCEALERPPAQRRLRKSAFDPLP